MTVLELLKDTLIHKEIILNVGRLMVDYLLRTGEESLAQELIVRLIEHDNSKVREEEVAAFTKLDDKGSMRNPDIVISEEEKKAIEIHWKNNSHHPEHFSDYHEMKEVDIIEMVCDWYARSKQYGTNFLEFVTTRQENRFHFDNEFFKKVKKYCLIILNEDIKKDA